MIDEDTVINVDCSNFITFPNEQILVAVKKHPLTLIANFSVIGFILLFFAIILAVGLYFITSIFLLFIGAICIALIGLALIIHTLIEGYYHTYIITNRRLLEIRFLPFAESMVNEILLDQVKCTELDMHSQGFVYNIFDVGTIMLTFDRPTHQETFVLSCIAGYRKVGMIISQLIVTQRQSTKFLEPQQSREVWFKVPNEQNKFRYFEESQMTHK